MTLVLLNVLIVAVITFEQQKHRYFLHFSFTFGNTNCWAKGVVVQQSFWIDYLKGREVCVDAACNDGFGVDNMVV
jgi:hypothetical protein